MFEKNKISLKNVSTCEKVISPCCSQNAVQRGFTGNDLYADRFDGHTVRAGKSPPNRARHHLLWGSPSEPQPGGYSPPPAQFPAGSVFLKLRMLFSGHASEIKSGVISISSWQV
jgi:hypothetical protein